MLKINNLHAYYGPIEALKGINLHVDEGKIVCLLEQMVQEKQHCLMLLVGWYQKQVKFLG